MAMSTLALLVLAFLAVHYVVLNFLDCELLIHSL